MQVPIIPMMRSSSGNGFAQWTPNQGFPSTPQLTVLNNFHANAINSPDQVTMRSPLSGINMNGPVDYKTLATDVWNQLLISGKANRTKISMDTVQPPARTVPMCPPCCQSNRPLASLHPPRLLYSPEMQQRGQGFFPQEPSGGLVFNTHDMSSYYNAQLHKEAPPADGSHGFPNCSTVHYARDERPEVPTERVIYYPVAFVTASGQLHNSSGAGMVPQREGCSEQCSASPETFEENSIQMQKLEERSAAVLLKERVLDSMKNELRSESPGKRLSKPLVQNGFEGQFNKMIPPGLRFNSAPVPINGNGRNVTDARVGEVFYGYQPCTDLHQQIHASKYVHVNGNVSLLTPCGHY